MNLWCVSSCCWRSVLITRLTVTPVALPTKSGSGVKVTLPFSSIVYIPSPGTFFSVVPSSNVRLTVSSIGTFGFPGTKTGVPVCGCPLGPSDSAGVPSGFTGVTIGVYVLV